MTRRIQPPTHPTTGHPYVDNALRNAVRGFQVELDAHTDPSWFYFHVGLPRKRKKYMKKISMKMNFVQHLIGTSKESK